MIFFFGLDMLKKKKDELRIIWYSSHLRQINGDGSIEF